MDIAYLDWRDEKMLIYYCSKYPQIRIFW